MQFQPQEHTAFYDDTTDEILFLTNTTPDITALELWRVGATRIYRPGDIPDLLVTIDPHGRRCEWPFTQQSPASLPPHPWIPYSEVTFGLADDELVDFDRWTRHHTDTDTADVAAAAAYPPHWDEYERPVLVCAPRQPFVSVPVPSAPPAPQPSASLAPSAPSAPLAPPTPLPPHIQRLVIDAAVSAATTCPITLDPITHDTAIVTPCGHVFGCSLDTVERCPVCRSPLALSG